MIVMLRLCLILILVLSCSKKAPKIETPQVDKSIATLNSYENDVEYKAKNQFDWITVNVNQGLQAYDKVKTGTNSTAEVEFKDHSVLKVYPQSIAIIIDRIKSKTDLGVLEIKKGKIDGQLLAKNSGESVLEVRNKLKAFKIKNKSKKDSNFRVQLKKKDIQINSLTNEPIYIEVDNKDHLAFKEPTVITAKGLAREETKLKPSTKRDRKNPIIPKAFYRLEFPQKDILTDKLSIMVKGDSFGYKVLLNGKEISTGGEFQYKYSLVKGLNILTFQFIYGQTIEFKVIKVTRQ